MPATKPLFSLCDKLNWSENRLTSTAVHSKAIGSWGTLVTATTNHVGFTLTLTSHLITLATEGALRVALTGWIQTADNKENVSQLSQFQHLWQHVIPHPLNLQSTYAEHHHEWWRKYCRWVWSTSQPGRASASSWRNPHTCSESSPPAAALPPARCLGNQEAQCTWESEPAIGGKKQSCI